MRESKTIIRICICSVIGAVLVVAQSFALNGLPAEYTELEYIQSSGTQYIDTGVMPSNDMKFETKLDFNAGSMNDDFFSSCRQTAGDTRYYLLNFNKSFGFVASNSIWSTSVSRVSQYDVSAPYTIESHIESTKTSLTVNGVTSSYTGNLGTLPTSSLPIFAGKTNIGSGNPTINKPGYAIRCYYAKYTDSGTLVRNFIPAKRNSDSVIGMYDTVKPKPFMVIAVQEALQRGQRPQKSQ